MFSLKKAKHCEY